MAELLKEKIQAGSALLFIAGSGSKASGEIMYEGCIEQLYDSEVQDTQYVCNGSNGAHGQASLVPVTTEPASGNCSSGGGK